MLGVLLGAVHKKGNFTNETTGEVISFDNIELVIVISPSVGGAYDPIEAIGQVTERSSKFPAENLSNVFGKDVKRLSDIEPWLGQRIEYFYDGSKKICKVLLNV